MQNCLGIYIESNLLKYAKVSKDKSEFKVESYGIKFYDDLNEAIRKVVEETYSHNTPISINLMNEKYMYYEIFSLLTKNDIQRTVQTEFESFCAESKYNPKAFETRYALVPDVEDKEKVKAIQVLTNKIELNKQKQFFEKYRLSKIIPIGTAIASVVNVEKRENILIVNMEEKTTVTTIYDRKIYNVESFDLGSQEILEKINLTEKSIQKAYEICKETTIYTSRVIDDAKEQPYLENIITTLYQIAQQLIKKVNESPLKINTIYLTGTLSVVNNVDLYFQELIPAVDCKILKPEITESSSKQLNIKEYIEVNSAISLAMQALGGGVQALNFRKSNVMDDVKNILNADVSFGKKSKGEGAKKEKQKFTLKGKLDKTETLLLRLLVAILLINVIFVTFSKTLYTQMNKKQKEVRMAIDSENSEIMNINKDKQDLNLKEAEYNIEIINLDTISRNISDISRMKNSIPNLLNNIMYIIPEEVQLTSLKHITSSDNKEEDIEFEDTENKEGTEQAEKTEPIETLKDLGIEEATSQKVSIVARSANYDQLGYFVAKIKVEGILKDVVTSGSQKYGEYVDVTIEGVLP